ncbi:outer membrane protein [Helicobacter acinonychis]|uniref:OMP163 n=1 Tax=Helicobacter acinonychis TaxID=212 RepID=A0A1M4NG40_HELAC|nr:outer membrane protein [Helicobacter acinonychis]SFZ70487.1 OMP484 [Helicobacter acinonychis]SFZ70586.1 OMP8 [Helicobacter acinonychis]SFZ70857.1 OMP163 [Helicobacter acinonychis]STP04321.1 outer membrane protein 13 [Helicobacter acinonychis]
MKTLLKMMVGTSLLVHALGAYEQSAAPSWTKNLYMGFNYQTGSINLLTNIHQVQQIIDYQNGYIRTISSVNGIKKLTNMGANGIGLVMGYKHFFHTDKVLGLRYFAFLDWQGYGMRYPKGYYGGNNMITYGVGVDAIWNFFQGSFYQDDISVDIGMFGGIAIAGNSWYIGDKGRELLGIANREVNNTSFQFLFNFGMRALFVDEHEFEIGFKFPTINNKYYTSDTINVQMRRVFAFYVGYNYHF